MKFPDVTRRPLAVMLLSAFPVCILGLLRHFLAPLPLEDLGMSSMPLAVSISRWAENHEAWNLILVVFSLFMSALFIARIMLQYSVVRSRNYVAVILYMYLATFLMPSQTLVGCLCGLVTTMGCMYAVRAFRKGYRFDAVFRSALWIGILPLLYAPMIVWILILPLLLAVLKRSLREIAVGMVALLLPFACMSYYYWCMGYDIGYLAWYMWNEATGYDYGFGISDFPLPVLVTVCVVCLTGLLSLIVFYRNRTGMRARPYRIMLFFSVMMLLIVPSVFLGGSNAMTFPIFAVPASSAMTYLVSRAQNGISFVAYFSIAFCIIASQVLLFVL